MLFHILSAHPELGSLGREGHDMWRKYHHPRRNGWKSDVISSGELASGEREFIDRYLYMHFDQTRFVEKTPESCLRIAYLKELYPDATFIFVKRDPREVMSSMLNGWRHPLGRFRSYFVPETLEIPGYGRPHQWCFALIDNWRIFKTQSLAHIVAEQWKQCIRGALNGRDLADSDHWIELTLDEFIADPVAGTSALMGRLDLSQADTPLDLARENEVINAMSELPPGNWQANAAELVEVFHLVKDEIEACGFDYQILLEETRLAAVSACSEILQADQSQGSPLTGSPS